MSEEQTPTVTGQAGPPQKKGVSPARNAIGLVVLVAVVAIGVIQYSAMGKFNSAINALNARMGDEEKPLMTESEAEALIGKTPDDAGTEVQEGTAKYTRKTYTWWSPLRSFTLAAYYTTYTTGQPPSLHHTESEGAKYEPASTKPADVPAGPPPGGPAMTKEGPGTGKGGPGMGKGGRGAGKRSRKKGEGKAEGAPKAQEKPEADEKPKAEAAPKEPSKSQVDEKPKAEPDAKDKAPEPKDGDQPKAGTDEPAKTPGKGA